MKDGITEMLDAVAEANEQLRHVSDELRDIEESWGFLFGKTPSGGTLRQSRMVLSAVKERLRKAGTNQTRGTAFGIALSRDCGRTNTTTAPRLGVGWKLASANTDKR